ncbi:hypothetical protein BGZ60DRAFT_515655 [Tricladium varicosporioides]|nr:hypothetical protein BGZ60DRAFT_515655 [Hymenoscyphus varicosporioides]
MRQQISAVVAASQSLRQAVQQVVDTLLLDMEGRTFLMKENWGVIAELYKLNVYSEPSDKFKPHVDTPRGLTQFGSLVVSLPSPHVGGYLRVNHKQITHVFDFGSSPSQEARSADEAPTLQ